MSQRREIYYRQIHQTGFIKIKKGISFCLQGKLIRHKQQRSAFYVFKYEFFFFDVLTAVVNVQHRFSSLFLRGKLPENIFYGIDLIRQSGIFAAEYQPAVRVACHAAPHCLEEVVRILSIFCDFF